MESGSGENISDYDVQQVEENMDSFEDSLLKSEIAKNLALDNISEEEVSKDKDVFNDQLKIDTDLEYNDGLEKENIDYTLELSKLIPNNSTEELFEKDCINESLLNNVLEENIKNIFNDEKNSQIEGLIDEALPIADVEKLFISKNDELGENPVEKHDNVASRETSIDLASGQNGNLIDLDGNIETTARLNNDCDSTTFANNSVDLRYDSDIFENNLLVREIEKNYLLNDKQEHVSDPFDLLHGNNFPKTSIKQNQSEDFRGLDVQEAELDFEEEVHVEQSTPAADDIEQKDRFNGDTDEKTEDNEKGDEAKDEDEGELDDDEDLEEGELKDPNGKKPLVRPVCRFYNKGHCTWGSSCRFIHPGFNDKGNYSMFADDKFSGLIIGPHPLSGPNHPVVPWVAELGPDGLPPPPPFIAEPVVESAWERGLRHAKELMKKANQRKETEPNYEEKRVNLSLEDEEIDKENEYQRRFGKTADSFFNYGYDDPRDYFEREQPYWQSGHYENFKFEVRWNKQMDFPHFRNRDREKDRPRPRESPPVPERQRDDRDRWRHDRYTENSSNTNVRTRADEWRDPWRRSVTPKRRSSSPRRRSRSRGNDRYRRSYSSGSSASYSSSGSSRSRSSSYSSYSGSSSGSSYYSSDSRSYSRSRSRSHSRSRSRSRTSLLRLRRNSGPPLPLTRKRPLPPPAPPPPPVNDPPRSQVSQIKPVPRTRSPERKKPSPPQHSNIPLPSRVRLPDIKPFRKPDVQPVRRSRSREWSRSKSYSSRSGSSSSRSRSLSVSSVSSVSSNRSSSSSADSQRMYARIGSPVSSKSRSPRSPSLSRAHKEERARAEKKRKLPFSSLDGKISAPVDPKLIAAKASSNLPPVANRSKDPLKHPGHKPIKLTLLSKPSEKPSNSFKKDSVDLRRASSPKALAAAKERKLSKVAAAVAAAAAQKADVRVPTSPPPSSSPDNSRADRKRPASSPLMSVIPSKLVASKKSTSSRREELLKQLKAVEDAIARKRAKLL